MAWNQTAFDDAFKRKQDIQQQNANSAAMSAGADVTRADASMLNVQQQPELHKMDNDAAFDRTKYSADSQNMMNQRDNSTKLTLGNQDFALGQARNSVTATSEAARDQRERIGASAGFTYDPVTDKYRQNPADFSKTPSPWDSYFRNFGLRGFERGGRPPVNHPFVVGENGTETFIPADGSDPILVGQNGPTVMTVPKPGFIEPNIKAIREGARAKLNQGQGQPAPKMSGVDAPWAGQSPRSPRVSPEGIVLPQEAMPVSPTAEDVIRARLGPRPAHGVVVVGASGGEQVPMREFNMYDAMQRDKNEMEIRAEYEKQHKPEFDPQAAVDHMKTLSPEDRQKYRESLPQDQLDAIIAHGTRSDALRLAPRKVGPPLLPEDQARIFAQARQWLGQGSSSRQKGLAPISPQQDSGDSLYDKLPPSAGKEDLRPVYERVVKPVVENSPSTSDWWRAMRMLAGFGTEEELAQWRARRDARGALKK